ncbi:uncharacterized protein LOC135487759 [Lineus longissimus]|uniref:uncharacterized protein LOC135487759 n=1 Tax=Lineus longissimus TaxID=88925 RepID=UPI00315D4FE2
MTALCQKIWEQKERSKKWTQSLIISLPKKGNLRLCQYYRTISLISHPSKVMLRIISSADSNPKVEEIPSEEQAGFKSGRSTTKQIFNIRLLVEKYLDHQKELHHNVIDFTKKGFDSVWHEGLWKVMRDYNIDKPLVRIIKELYNQLGDFFRTAVRVGDVGSF